MLLAITYQRIPQFKKKQRFMTDHWTINLMRALSPLLSIMTAVNVEYTFLQIGNERGRVNMTGNFLTDFTYEKSKTHKVIFSV